MKHYKKPNCEIFAFESDGSQDDLIKSDMVEMTQAEIDAHINPPLSQAELDEIAFQEWKHQKELEQELLLRQEYEAQK